jgi:hypothetical protein
MAACGGGAPAPAPETEGAAAAVPASAQAFKPVMSLNQIMVDVINESAHGIWDLDIPGREPKTDEDWSAVRHAAATIAAGGSITLHGGSGAEDTKWIGMPEWQSMSQAMTDKGLQALVAAERRNMEAVRTAGNELLLTCIQCHNAYRLGIPNIWAEREQKIPTQ